MIVRTNSQYGLCITQQRTEQVVQDGRGHEFCWPEQTHLKAQELCSHSPAAMTTPHNEPAHASYGGDSQHPGEELSKYYQQNGQYERGERNKEHQRHTLLYLLRQMLRFHGLVPP